MVQVSRRQALGALQDTHMRARMWPNLAAQAATPPLESREMPCVRGAPLGGWRRARETLLARTENSRPPSRASHFVLAQAAMVILRARAPEVSCQPFYPRTFFSRFGDGSFTVF